MNLLQLNTALLFYVISYTLWIQMFFILEMKNEKKNFFTDVKK